MKKSYKTPSVEVVKFQYSDQVVAASSKCYTKYDQTTDPCQFVDWLDNQV